MWVKNKVTSHWDFIGRKTKIYIRRNFLNKTVLIDFMCGGSCTLYTYDGKRIVG